MQMGAYERNPDGEVLATIDQCWYCCPQARVVALVMISVSRAVEEDVAYRL